MVNREVDGVVEHFHLVAAEDAQSSGTEKDFWSLQKFPRTEVMHSTEITEININQVTIKW